jgi:hypothetical protein
MEEFLSKDTIKILRKYKDIEPFEHINGVEICSVDQSDLSFMVGYISASLRIERNLNEKIERYEKALREIERWDSMLYSSRELGNFAKKALGLPTIPLKD